MLLKRKIAASSIAEVLIAVSIIAICFGIASIVFIRSTKSMTNTSDLIKQTEVLNKVWNKLDQDTVNVISIDQVRTEGVSVGTNSLSSFKYLNSEGQILWVQDYMTKKND